MTRSFGRPKVRLGRTATAVVACGVLLGGAITAMGMTPAAAATVVAGHWGLDEGTGTTAADSSGNGNTGTLRSGATWATGPIGTHAVALNGTATGNIDIPTPVVDTSQSFTVSAWVKLNSTAGFQTVASIDGTNVSGFFLQLRADTGKFAFTRIAGDSATGGSTASASSAPTTGSWYHLVGVDDVSAGKLHLYVDGQQTDADYTGQWKATGHTLIGRGLFGGAPVDFVNGSVDDVQMYQGALTTTQVRALDQSAHWNYDEGSGTVAADSSGHGQDQTLDSGATWTAGRIGPNALALNGTATGNATTTGPVADTRSSFSVSSWVKLNSTTGFQTVASMDGSNVSGFYLQLRGDTGKFAFTRLASDSTSAAVSYASATTAPTAGTWYHLVGVDDIAAGRLLLYVNGVLQGSVAYTGNWQASGKTAVGRGLFNGSPADFLDGTVDEVQVLNHAATAGEVQAIIGSAGGQLAVDASTSLHALPSTFFGLMTEDINHSMTGGLYPELINNRSMMASTSSPTDWSAVGGSAISLDSANPLNTALTRSLKVDVDNASAGTPAGVANGGYWGIPVTPSQTYTANFFAKASAGFTGSLTVDVESTDGSTVYASGTVKGVGTGWKQFNVTLHTSKNAPTTADARFVLSTSGNNGKTLWLDNVSLFPPTYDNVKNGLRPDLMTKFAGLKPSFIREPGGNYLEGNTIATRFNWKDTIGPVWTRPGHQDDAWGYFSTDGMGLLEYLEWCEQLNAQPLLAVYAGYSLNGSTVPQDQLAPYVQDALDEIEYATGSTSTTWGAKRAADGHPAAFKVDYVEVGNEDQFDRSTSYNDYRFPMFNDAIKAAYPSMKVIATTAVTARTPEVVDEHFYETAAWMNSHANLYDNRSRSGPKIMVGEWATREGSPTPNLNAALGDASWLTGLVRNSDIVTQEAYAPMLVNVNDVAWSTDLIGFDALTSYNSPSYYVQAMMAKYHGDQVLGATYAGVGGINTVATKDSVTGKIYLTVVNPGSAAQPITVDLTGAGAIPSTGSATVLTSAHPTDTNTITNPGKVAPTTAPVSGLGATFTRSFPAYSVTVLTLG